MEGLLSFANVTTRTNCLPETHLKVENLNIFTAPEVDGGERFLKNALKSRVKPIHSVHYQNP